MNKKDFIVTDKEIEQINSILSDFTKSFAKAGEICEDIDIIFSFSILGRTISVSYSGSTPIEI